MKMKYECVEFIPIHPSRWLVVNMYDREICGEVHNANPGSNEGIAYFKGNEERLYSGHLLEIAKFMKQIDGEKL